MKAIRTVACDKSGQNIYSATAAVAVTSYGRDEKHGQKWVRFKSIDGSMANSDLALTLHEDGRLKGLNATTVGKGEEILKSAIQLASFAFGGGLEAAFLSTKGKEKSGPCKLIDAVGGKEQMVTLTYVGSENFEADGDRATKLGLEPGSPKYATRIDAALKPVCLGVGKAIEDKLPVKVAAGEDGLAGINLQLRQPAKVPIFVSEIEAGACGYHSADAGKKLMAGTLLVPQRGTPYSLPIPKAALFGKQSFVLALGDSGVITTLQYAKETGAAGMLGVVNAGLAEAAPGTAAEKAAEVKAEADLIAQQQRLLRCQIDQKACT